VIARNCEEALDALALIAAISLDPLASTEPVPEEEPLPPAEEGMAGASGGGEKTGASAAQAPGSLGKAEPGSPKEAVVTKPGEDDEAEEGDPETGTEESQPEPVPAMAAGVTPSVILGLLGGVLFGPAPELMPGASAFLILDWEDVELWTPALRLSVARHLRQGLSESGGTAEFSLNQLAVEACAFSLRSGGFSLRPCLLVLGGQLHAEGSDTEAAASETRPWWALGASALLFFKTSEQLLVVARFGGGYPLVRDTFQFKPEAFHHVPPITLEASLGVGFRFQ
jgi:hypothetical protein